MTRKEIKVMIKYVKSLLLYSVGYNYAYRKQYLKELKRLKKAMRFYS